MLTEQQILHYWNYAELLNEELGNTARFVEPDVSNYQTYSLAYTNIILSACSEVEIVCRLLCQTIDAEKGYTTPEKWIQMKDISKTILKRFPHIYQARTEILQKQEYIYPFKVWESNEKDILPWWKEYDLIKHYRHQKFNHATLENALNSVAALIILNSYLYELVLGEHAPRMTRFGMFDNCYSYCGLVVQPNEKLPDMQMR